LRLRGYGKKQKKISKKGGRLGIPQLELGAKFGKKLVTEKGFREGGR